MTIETKTLPKRPGTIAVVCAGTSDLPVAEEAAVTAEIMGNRVERIADVGVAGVHRLFGRLETIQQANVVIVVAGMEGALPSVVAGLGCQAGDRRADQRGLWRQLRRTGRRCWACSIAAPAA